MLIKSLLGIILFPLVLILGWWGVSDVHHHYAYAHFEDRCEADGGEFIYKTVDDVEGFFLMRLRDPRDFSSRMRMRDIPEDPYNHTNWESQRAEYLFIGPPHRFYKYVEMPWRDIRYLDKPFKRIKTEVTKSPYLKFWGHVSHYYGEDDSGALPMQLVGIDEPTSRYGVTWRGFRTERDEFYGVWGGEVIVKDLQLDEILAIRRGYFLYPWSSSTAHFCPPERSGSMPYEFISKILKPALVPVGKD